jgi:1-acyl-sn-glycerol-3-phosphate acyltransferase
VETGRGAVDLASALSRLCGPLCRAPGDRFLFVANHVTWLDILALGGASRAIFVSRDDVAGWPFVGWLASLNDTLYVARQARREVHGQADQLRSAVDAGRAVALFPEGTTDVDLMPFRPSLFQSMFPPIPGAKVQPVAIDYGSLADEIAWMDEEGAGANATRVLSRKGSIPVRLTFLEPIDPQTTADRKVMAAHTRAAIAGALAGQAASDEAGYPLYGPQ